MGCPSIHSSVADVLEHVTPKAQKKGRGRTSAHAHKRIKKTWALLTLLYFALCTVLTWKMWDGNPVGLSLGVYFLLHAAAGTPFKEPNLFFRT